MGCLEAVLETRVQHQALDRRDFLQTRLFRARVGRDLLDGVELTHQIADMHFDRSAHFGFSLVVVEGQQIDELVLARLQQRTDALDRLLAAGDAADVVQTRPALGQSDRQQTAADNALFGDQARRATCMKSPYRRSALRCW